MVAALIIWLGVATGAANAASVKVDGWSSGSRGHRAVFDNRVGSSFDDAVHFALPIGTFGHHSTVSMNHDNGIKVENIELWGGGRLLHSGSGDDSGSHLSFLADSNTKDYELRVRGRSDSGDAAYCGEIVVSAIPEPQTYAMLLVGLGLVGFSARRRKHN